MDTVSKKKRSSIMSAVRHFDTAPELTLRRELSKLGLRYRTHYGKEKIDIAFPSKRLAVFVNGCFWHDCPEHGGYPKSNRDYWIPKLKRNIERDMETDAKLKKEGWRLMRFWEHKILENPAKCASRVALAIKSEGRA